jgi:hypothetical protein
MLHSEFSISPGLVIPRRVLIILSAVGQTVEVSPAIQTIEDTPPV